MPSLNPPHKKPPYPRCETCIFWCEQKVTIKDLGIHRTSSSLNEQKSEVRRGFCSFKISPYHLTMWNQGCNEHRDKNTPFT